LEKQTELEFEKQTKKEKEKDEFAASCRPLGELLDSVRDIEGFPIAKDEEILAHSDAPYYTACPSPYLNDFIARYGKPYDKKKDKYKRAPFVSDVSEGKNDLIYNAHSYHTKVPHKAIMPFIEHYTEPGDIVFDGFCGTGMTGVASQMLGRKAILSDLSPAATFIAYNYNTPVDAEEFEKEAREILQEIEEECGWMYETLHTDGKTKGKINYTVWSDIFICPYCSNEYVFWDVASDKETGKVRDEYSCPHCNAQQTKRKSERARVTLFDDAIGEEVNHAKQVPVLINYTIGKTKYEKTPGQPDLDIIKTIEESAIPYWFPTDRMPEGDESRRNDKIGITHVHHFYTKKNLWVLAALWSKSEDAKRKAQIRYTYEQAIWGMSKLARYVPTHYSQVNQYLSGTLYIGSQVVEVSPGYILNNKIGNLKKVFAKMNNSFDALVSTNSASQVQILSNTVDYIFTDPPFGDNLMYSELNFLWEVWHRVRTNNKSEAIMNNQQSKSLNEYKELMTLCFKEMYRILKPNRWITIVFHNSKASVWNAIQDAITRAGFIIAQVTVLDKKQGSFKQVTSAGAVKNDLVINAYKPKKDFEEQFLRLAGEGLEQEFVQEHLDHLPVEINIERTEQMLYSKMLANYIQRGYEIGMNAPQFYAMLRDRFKLIDGYWFNDDQVLDYGEWKKAQGLEKIREIKNGLQVFFVSDEKSLLIWLYQFLGTPQSFGDVFTASRKVITDNEDEIPELRELLDQNFIVEKGTYRRPHTPAEQEKIEAQRERDLLRSFDQILNLAKTSSKKIKGIRKEAVILGFTQAYQEKRYQDILDVSKRLDQKLIENDSQINDFVEFARFKTGEEL